MMNARTVFALATFFGLGVTLLILSCVLSDDKEGHKHNAWPLLIGGVYLLLPMPMLCGGLRGDEYASLGGGASSWVDFSKFVTGMCGSLVVGLPIVLTHAGKMYTFQLAYALPASLVLAGTAVGYDYASRQSSEDGWSYEQY